MIGKVRLAPIKTVMIPRLEMTAATVSIHLGEMMNKELDDKPDIAQHHTESTAMLRYIGNDQKRFQVFVANRVQLCNFSNPSQWRYVKTKENPAADASDAYPHSDTYFECLMKIIILFPLRYLNEMAQNSCILLSFLSFYDKIKMEPKHSQTSSHLPIKFELQAPSKKISQCHSVNLPSPTKNCQRELHIF